MPLRGAGMAFDDDGLSSHTGLSIMNTPALDLQKLEAFAGRVVGDVASAYGVFLGHIGAQLGLYRAMAGMGPLTSAELAARSDCAERYVREWLNAQAAGGYVDYHPASDRFELTPEQAMVLADEDSPVYMPPAWNVPASLWTDEKQLLQAFRTGRGVAWSERDARLSCGVAAFYRNGYRASLVPQWLPALDGVVEQLTAGIQVVDVGCGHGHSTVLMAQAFPNSRFFGFDSHAPSIEEARRQAARAGVADRVYFGVARATDFPGSGYGLACCFDTLHDLGDPVAAVRHVERALAPGGSLMLVEPFAHDRAEHNHNTVGRLYFGGSTAICCAHALADGGELVLGAQAGPARLRDVLQAGGLGDVAVKAETPFNLVLQARRSATPTG
jgi:SAM-dependent methyltransferase